MTYFLERVAKLLIDEYSDSIGKQCIVFPNRRAGLYFIKYLSSGIKKPVWSPQIFTINDLFRHYSSLQKADNELLLFELYKVYRTLKTLPESFDNFYFWGEMLLNDFDDVDKYLVDASLIFRNVKDINEINNLFGGLTETQIEIIKRFWINFDAGKPTEEKEGFVSIWSCLSDLYSAFKGSLAQNNVAYEGMIFRDVVEKPEDEIFDSSKWDAVHFVGFNALNECEHKLMTLFKSKGMARFYWDYDNSYINDDNHNSAGHFLRKNIKKYGNDMPEDWSNDTMLSSKSSEAKRVVINTSSDVAQVKLIPGLIKKFPELTRENAHYTAVILPDENLLIPALNTLSEDIGDINITMGYPLKHTVVYTLIKDIMELQKTATDSEEGLFFNYRYVLSVLKHPLLSDFADNDIVDEITEKGSLKVAATIFDKNEKLSKIFIKPATPEDISEYFSEIVSLVAVGNIKLSETSSSGKIHTNIINEFLFRVALSINKLKSILDKREVIFTTETYMRLLDRMLVSLSVPFSGEPLSGVQVMGILETRALDFKNLIILSVNEGVLPSVSVGSSFIPFSLREAFGLPSINHQESIYAYHFFRLLHRAENVVFTYNSNAEEMRNGEMSRFLVQMNYDEILKPDFIDLGFEIKAHPSVSERLERSERHLELLKTYFLSGSSGRLLSPSAINTWLNCRMKFYYRYVKRLKEPDKLTTEIDPAVFGNLVHNMLRILYKDFVGKVVTKEMIDTFKSDRNLQENLAGHIIACQFKKRHNEPLNGQELIVRDVLISYLIRILDTDSFFVPFSIRGLEDQFSFTIPISVNHTDTNLSVGGIIDRIDIVNGSVRVVDYKTGSVTDRIYSVNDLFIDDRKKEYDAWLQTLIYCEAYLSGTKENVIYPSVYRVRKQSDSYTDKLKIKSSSGMEMVVEDYRSVRDEFINGLNQTVNKIFSDDEPFTMTKDVRAKCSYCSYRSLCMR